MEIDMRILKACAQRHNVTRIRNILQEGFGREMKNDEDLLFLYQQAGCAEMLRDGKRGNVRGLGEAQAEGIEWYLMHRGVLEVDHQFSHLPKVGMEERRYVERGELTARDHSACVYTVGINGAQLVYGSQARGDKVIETASLHLDDILKYRRLR